ncbi:hypothetical protein EP073_12455 [Geovibrio thiophilus]|uniref:Uncharacterized protein n=1 Tax=Geovibrio thiophilus TaxID=139438 RepID=A0A3R5X4F1_9BACT|nr:hypothetical protein [Geovibrio thiophilus]QAR34185.1 hypothetical protein EP073_12455 [Geovibrio thiophilus]
MDISSSRNLSLITVLSYLFLLIIPFLMAVHYVFILLFLLYFAFVPFKLDLPIYLYSYFILYDLMTLLLLNSGSDFNSILFQAIMLIIISLYCLKYNVYNNNFFFVMLLITLVETVYGLTNSGSVVGAVAFIKNLLIFPALLILGYRTDLSSSKNNFWLFVVVMLLSFLVNGIQDIYGFEKFFLNFGYDIFYYSRNISGIGEIPIGIATYDIINQQTSHRMLGIFLSPDKAAYVMYGILLFLFIWIEKKLSVFLLMFISAFMVVPLYFFHVKAILLNLMVFFYSYFLIRIFNIQSLIKRTSVALFMIILMAIWALNAKVVAFSSSGAIQHVWGLFYPILNSLNSPVTFLMGNGIGTGGTVGQQGIVSELSKAARGGESFIGSLFYQMGLLGLLVYAALYLYLDRIFLKKSPYSYKILSSILLGVFISSMFSEPVLSIFQVSCYMLVIQYVIYKESICGNTRI